ncbi:hypothetical protein [Nocardia farcinica]|uniref:hypothetical protein n=1 Tax=Nocardia farcinica TaxID=37329 RepID=UPI0018942E87|nr:hypothetical protein [Nocardia farcinica]MBF6233433.1 hypothetical protein [Nocardia farcinica]MBF6250997.1 hypothetical protein [Nocardia farcinica]
MSAWHRVGWLVDNAGQWRPVYADGVVGDPLTRELAELHADVEAALAAVWTDDKGDE